MNNKTKLISLGVVAVGVVSYFIYVKFLKQPSRSTFMPNPNSPKNACGRPIGTGAVCIVDKDNDGNCYDWNGNSINSAEMTSGMSCFNKDGSNRNVSYISI